MISQSSDPRIFYGVNCCWFGTFDEAAEHGSRCPYCKGMVGTFSDEAAFWKHVDDFENGVYEVHAEEATPKRHPGFRKMWEWGGGEMKRRKTCYKNVNHLRNSYRKHEGIEVDTQR